MSQELWTSVDEYFERALIPVDPVLDGALKRAAAAGLPDIGVAANLGKLLHLLARMRGARRILEVGTLGGYSTIWLARALPEGGSLLSLELEPACAEAARASLAEAGLADRAEVRIGPAAESLAALVETRVEPFDFVFIDADKPSNPLYLKYALRLTKPGSAILIDNMAYKGKIAVPGIENDSVRGTRQTFEMLAAEPRLSATAVQTVGRNGHDGFVLALVDG